MNVITEIENTSRELSSVSIESYSKFPLKENQSSNISRHRSGSGDCDLTEEDQLKYNKLVKKSKAAAQEGNARLSLQLLHEAAKIQNSEKIERRIKKLEDWIKEYGDEDEEEDEEENGMSNLGDGFHLHKDIAGKLFSYQVEGIQWFWSLHKKKAGGILGDDMGLGKTIQVIGFLSGLFDAERVKSVLIVMPASLIINWEKEFDKWAPGVRVMTYHGSSKRERERALAKVQRRGGVLLTTYGLITNNWQEIGADDMSREFVWDYVILDEGHKIKSPTIKCSKAVHAIAARRRYILTGTPIQNNLKELWALFDFVTQGRLLGTQKTFALEYESPIVRARQKDATASEKRLGNEMAESLRNIIAPYFLRRTKAETLEKKKKQTEEGSGSVEEGAGKSADSKAKLTRKNDFILWVFLSDIQQKVYKDLASSDEVRELLMTNRSPLAMLNILKKICDHPRLLSKRACSILNLEGEETSDFTADQASEIALEECAANNIEHISNQALTEESGKMVVLVALLNNLKSEGHRTLVFSQSRKMLDIVQKVLEGHHFKVMRMDGTIRKFEDRDRIIRKFQKDPSYSVFLLTTGVGGVGLTLTAADRVVIFDPSWNPATDNQAVDRAYRIGQKKTVVIYRLISCGSVEEKIYRRQIFKDSITRQATGYSKDPYRYFTGQQLRELFVLDDPHVSSTQMQLQELHSNDRKSSTDLDEHIAFLHSLDVFGISDHDLMFSQEDEEDGPQDATVESYVHDKVRKAKELLTNESNLAGQLNENIRQNTEFPSRNIETMPPPRRLPETPFMPSVDNGPPRFRPNRPLVKETETVDLTMMDDDDEGDSRGNKESPKAFVDLTMQQDGSDGDMNESLANMTIEESSPESAKGQDMEPNKSGTSSDSSNDLEFHTVDDIPASDIPKPINLAPIQEISPRRDDQPMLETADGDVSTDVAESRLPRQDHSTDEISSTGEPEGDLEDFHSRPGSAMLSADDGFRDSHQVLPEESSPLHKKINKSADVVGTLESHTEVQSLCSSDGLEDSDKISDDGRELEETEEYGVDDNHDESFNNLRSKGKEKVAVISDEEDSESHSDEERNEYIAFTSDSNIDDKMQEEDEEVASEGEGVAVQDEVEEMDISSDEGQDTDKLEAAEVDEDEEELDDSFGKVKRNRNGRRVIDSESEDDSETGADGDADYKGDESISESREGVSESEESQPRGDTSKDDVGEESDGNGTETRRRVSESSSCLSVEIDSKTCQVSIAGDESKDENTAEDSGSVSSGSDISIEVHSRETQASFPSPQASDEPETEDEQEKRMEEILSKSVCLNDFSSDEEENRQTPRSSCKLGLRANSSAKRRRSSCHIRYMSKFQIDNDDDDDVGDKQRNVDENASEKDAQNVSHVPFILDSDDDDDADLEPVVAQLSRSGEKVYNMTFVDESPVGGREDREDEDRESVAFVQDTPDTSPVSSMSHKSRLSEMEASTSQIIVESDSDGEIENQQDSESGSGDGVVDVRGTESDSEESFQSAVDGLSEDEADRQTSSDDDVQQEITVVKKKKAPKMIEESFEEEEEAEDVELSDRDENSDETGDDVEGSYADDEEEEEGDDSLDGFVVNDVSGEDGEDDEEYEEEEEEGSETDGAEAETDSDEELSEEAKNKYKSLVKEGRSHQKNGNVEAALKAYLSALDISGHDTKLQKMTLKLYRNFKWR